MSGAPPAYACYVFDCDGVVLDSNRIKTEAFRAAALLWGAAPAEALVRHHVANGGISRFAKFRHFLDHLVPEGASGPGYEAMLEAYAAAVRQGLLDCAVAPGLTELRAATRGARWLIASGGAQAELREVFAARGLDGWFDGGIFGSPDTKDEILAREQALGRLPGPALFIGDSTYDYRAASAAGLDFRFATYWTEVPDWPDFVHANGIATVAGIGELLPG